MKNVKVIQLKPIVIISLIGPKSYTKLGSNPGNTQNTLPMRNNLKA